MNRHPRVRCVQSHHGELFSACPLDLGECPLDALEHGLFLAVFRALVAESHALQNLSS